MFDRRQLKKLDYYLIVSVAVVILISLVIISSATHVNSTNTWGYYFVERQGISVVFNIVIILFFLHIDYNILRKFANGLYIINLVMLLAVMFVGQSALGAQRWIQLGAINFQPSEISKVIIIIALANMLEKRIGKLNSLKDILPILLYIFIPFLLVLKQPDLGTALVFLAIVFGMLYMAGVKMRIFGQIFFIGLVAIPLFWNFILQDYQKQRLTVFIDPNVDPLGLGYHIIQSKIAIGSGKLFGKGLYNGTQSQLNFLPENHTDFIFAVIGEEFGFIGTSIMLFLFFIILYRSVKIIDLAKDNFGMLLAAGITSMFMFHILVNVGMTSGIMPVTGIPLLFMSYGVSALTANMLSIGILLNVYMRRKKILF